MSPSDEPLSTLDEPYARRRPRIWAGVATIVIELTIAVLILSTSRRVEPRAADEDLKTFSVAPVQPPEVTPPPPKPKVAAKHAGKAAPPNLRAKATEITAPKTAMPLPVPPIAVATKAGTGAAANAGAAAVAGPGSGAGGAGEGTGSGGDGEGDGGDTAPRQIGGRIKNTDYPRSAAAAGFEGTVTVSYTIETNGRASHCEIARSSGNRDIDETTCRLIVERFRFAPSRDRNGTPITSYIDEERHSWNLRRDVEGAGAND